MAYTPAASRPARPARLPAGRRSERGGGLTRRSKIVCTLGPATGSPEVVRALVEAGMDVARLNFSHGSLEQHRLAVDLVREAAEAAGRVVAVMADLSGPKVRLGELAEGVVDLPAGARFVLSSARAPGNERRASTSHPRLAADLRRGDRVFLADGAVELEVAAIEGGEVVTQVVRGGRVTNRAGVSVPAERLSLPPITAKDRTDLAAALDLGVDLVAQSFVRAADEVQALRELMGEPGVPVVAKIENRLAVERSADIAATADAVMVARGDLGVGGPLEEVPILQKEIVATCRALGTPSIVATQMLESMLASPRPTRAEVSDVANAILDGADAVLLSAETAIGRFPVESLRTAARVAEVTGAQGERFRLPSPTLPTGDEERAVARAATRIAREEVEVSAIACFARTGRTARLIAAERPPVPIYAFAADAAVVRVLATVWGITPIPAAAPTTVDEVISLIDRRLVGAGHRAMGELVVLVGTAPVGLGPTNLVKLHRLGSPGYG